jgi:hypothetical protein
VEETNFWKLFKNTREGDYPASDSESLRSWARRCGVDVNVLIGWQRGAIPKAATLRKVADSLGVPEKMFYSWVDTIS